jgi:cytoskeletal protein CcmA (bactofilin family)
MFKRTEESEWSRFSKAFTGKEKDDDESSPSTADNAEAAAMIDDDAPPTITTTPVNRSGVPDTNLTVGRSAANAGAYPSYSSDDVESTIGEHTFFDGTYKSDNSIRIKGTAQGEVECAKAVFIEENAKVSAKVTASSITVAGEVNGELNCTGRVEIRPTGRVTGTINAGVLVMQEGAFFDGNLRMKQTTAAETATA